MLLNAITGHERDIAAARLFTLCLAAAASAAAQEKVTFQDHVLPLVESHCAKCHNPDKLKGDLDLSSYNGTLKGGASGPTVVSGNPDSSKLWKALTHAEEPTMPPNKPRLPDKELEIFKKWITGGLLETTGSKAVASKASTVDLSLKVTSTGKPDGPPPMPKDLSTAPVVHTSAGNAILGLAASPWAPVVAVAGQKQVLLYHTDSLDLLGILACGDDQPWDLKFSRSGRLLVAGGGHGAKSGRVLLWNIETGARVAAVGRELDTVLAADVSPDQTRVALGGPDRLVKVYAIATGELEHKIKKHTDWVTALAFSPNGEFLLSGDRNGGLVLWDADSGQELFTYTGHKAAITSVSWRSDSKTVVSASEDGSVRIWETQEGKQVRTWNAHAGGALGVNYAHDGRLVTCGRDGLVTTWATDGTKGRSFEFGGQPALRAVFSHDGARVIASDFTGRVAVWQATNGARIGDLDANPRLIEDQVAAAQRLVDELTARGDKPSPEQLAAERELAEAEAARQAAARTLEAAQALKAEKEAIVEKLKLDAVKTQPPPNIDALLAAARAERGTARDSFTNATTALEKSAKTVEAAKKKAESAKGENPAEALARARARLAKLKAAQSQAALLRARETLAARKQERDDLEASLKERRESLKTLVAKIDEAKTPEAKSAARAALKTATAGLKEPETALKKLNAELAAEQARVDKLAAEFERVRAAAVQQVKL
jgi:WD40 repeat protein